MHACQGGGSLPGCHAEGRHRLTLNRVSYSLGMPGLAAGACSSAVSVPPAPAAALSRLLRLLWTSPPPHSRRRPAEQRHLEPALQVVKELAVPLKNEREQLLCFPQVIY